MSDLTREQIEARIAVLDRLIEHGPQHSAGWQMDAIAYRMALRALDADPTLTCVCAEIDERDRPCLVCESNAPDLPEQCARCGEALCECETEAGGMCRGYRMRSDGRVFHCDRGRISVPDLSGIGGERFVCRRCRGTGRAGGGGHE